MRAIIILLLSGLVLVPGVASAQASDVTDQEQDYFDALQDDTERIVELSSDLADTFFQVGNNPTVIFDQTWQLRTAALLVEWEHFHTKAQDMDPSPRQAHIHEMWLAVTELMAWSSEDFVTGFDTIDAAALERGSARITYAALLITDITDAILAFNDDPNAPFVPTHAFPPVESCESFPDFDEAQEYYAAYPDAQPVIDPDWDGLACEVFFGRG